MSDETSRRRRSLLLAGLAAAGLLLGYAALGPSGDPAGPPQREITVGLIGGSWLSRVERLVEPQMAAAGIKVRYVAGTADDWRARLIAARGHEPPVDVAEGNALTVAELRKGRLIQPLRTELLPNLRGLNPNMRESHGVAYWASQPAILYNPDKLAAAGVKPPQRYSDLLAPELAGRLILPDVSSYSAFYLILGLAYENGGGPDNLQPGFDALARLRPLSYVITSETVGQLFSSGAAWVTVFPAHIATHISDGGLNIRVSHPVIDGHKVALTTGLFSIADGARDVEAAHIFLNAVISAEVQTAIFRENAILPVHNDAIAFARDTSDLGTGGAGVPRSAFQIFDPDAIRDAWVHDIASIDYQDWARRWQRAVSSQSQ